MLVFGDSLSAGYGIGLDQAWPTLLQRELDAGHPGIRVSNASVSGETTEGGLRRLKQTLTERKPQIVILELGANDGLRGAAPAEIEARLEQLITTCQHAGAKVLLLGMRLPPNYGPRYTAAFAALFRRQAERHRTAFLPFLLDGLEDADFQADHLHPSAAAQTKLMRAVYGALKPLLR